MIVDSHYNLGTRPNKPISIVPLYIQIIQPMSDALKETIIDMPDSSDMKAEAMKEAKFGADNIKIENKIAKHIKQKFDEKYGPNWHCVVGKNFSSFVSYESKHYIFFYEGQLAVLLYKMG